MSKAVSKSVFKARALEFFREVEATGEPLVITHRGEPVLELRVIARRTPAEQLAHLRASVLFFDDSLEPVDVAWEANQ